MEATIKQFEENNSKLVDQVVKKSEIKIEDRLKNAETSLEKSMLGMKSEAVMECNSVVKTYFRDWLDHNAVN